MQASWMSGDEMFECIRDERLQSFGNHSQFMFGGKKEGADEKRGTINVIFI